MAAALRLGGDGAAGWGGPGRACGKEFLAILDGKEPLWSRERRVDAAIRLGIVRGRFREAYGALVRVSARPGLWNPPEITGNTGPRVESLTVP